MAGARATDNNNKVGNNPQVESNPPVVGSAPSVTKKVATNNSNYRKAPPKAPSYTPTRVGNSLFTPPSRPSPEEFVASFDSDPNFFDKLGDYFTDDSKHLIG